MVSNEEIERRTAARAREADWEEDGRTERTPVLKKALDALEEDSQK